MSPLWTKKSLLILEHKSATRDLLISELVRAGFDPVCVDTGEQALALIRERRDSLVGLMTAVDAPGPLNGWMLGTEFQLRDPVRPVIYFTSQRAHLSRALPCSAVVRRPYSALGVLAVLGHLCSVATPFGSGQPLQSNARWSRSGAKPRKSSRRAG